MTYPLILLFLKLTPLKERLNHKMSLFGLLLLADFWPDHWTKKGHFLMRALIMQCAICCIYNSYGSTHFNFSSRPFSKIITQRSITKWEQNSGAQMQHNHIAWLAWFKNATNAIMTQAIGQKNCNFVYYAVILLALFLTEQIIS